MMHSTLYVCQASDTSPVASSSSRLRSRRGDIAERGTTLAPEGVLDDGGPAGVSLNQSWKKS